MSAFHRMFFLLSSAVAIIALSGCTKGYHYDLTCVVRNAADGKPLEGVSAVVDTWGNKEDLSFGTPISDPSDTEGRFRYKFFVTMRSPEFSASHWYLKLQKDGFVPEIVDIKPGPEPEKAGTTTSIFIVVDIHPKIPPR